jgi:hypothetical protein
MPARLDKPPRLTGAAKTAEAQFGGGQSLQSLLMMSHGFTRDGLARSTRDGSTRLARGREAMPVETIRAA